LVLEETLDITRGSRSEAQSLTILVSYLYLAGIVQANGLSVS